MENLLTWGVDIIVWLQQASPALDPIFKFFTFLGDELFFLLFMPVIIWCVDYSRGVRLTILFLGSAYFNSLAKELGRQPRPFEYDPRARKLVEATGYGFPSGHTQSTVTIWGYIAAQFRNQPTLILAIIMIIMIPLSRIYLGVHFPTDVIGGYVMGAVFLLLYIKLENSVISWLKELRLGFQILLAVIVPVLAMLTHPGDIMDKIPTCATLMGGSIGLALVGKWIEFNAAGIWWKRALRYLVGMVIVGLFYFGLKIALKGLEPAAVYRFIRYCLVGFSITFLAPWIFNRVKLSSADGTVAAKSSD